MTPTIVIALQTGGPNPLVHPLLEIGAVLVADTPVGPCVQASFRSFVARYSGSVLEPDAMAINGITNDELRDAPSIHAVRTLWETWVATCQRTVDAPLQYAAWHAATDAAFLLVNHLWTPADVPIACVSSAARSLWGQDAHLNPLAASLGLLRMPEADARPHRALSNAELAAQVLIAIDRTQTASSPNLEVLQLRAIVASVQALAGEFYGDLRDRIEPALTGRPVAVPAPTLVSEPCDIAAKTRKAINIILARHDDPSTVFDG